MRDIFYSNQFEKDLRKIKAYKGFNKDKLKAYVNKIANGEPLPPAAKQHKLAPSSPKKYKGMFDFHIAADICVVYEITDTSVNLFRIGKHNNLGLTENI